MCQLLLNVHVQEGKVENLMVVADYQSRCTQILVVVWSLKKKPMN